MKRNILILLITLPFFLIQNLFPQFKLDFGNITVEQLSNRPYLPDPGADAIILSDIGIVNLNYNREFYLEVERDVKIRIVNSKGFDYANIEIPYSYGDKLINFRASSFNIRNGEKVETVIPRKSFIREDDSKYKKVLKINFPDVQEGTVIEYSYIMILKDESIYSLIPWSFQSTIPVEFSSLGVAYPEFFTYKSMISGNPLIVTSTTTFREQRFGTEPTKVNFNIWTARNVPATKHEPLAKGSNENKTRITFELSRVNFPYSTVEEISPSYETLTEKLLKRSDFGLAIKNTSFLKKIAKTVTLGLTEDIDKVKAVHKYISENILWNGDYDFTASGRLRKVFYKEKGNSADINMILISMLRNLGIQAEPVIMSTRSNGTLNQYSAMLQQFNYLVAVVYLNGRTILIDATNPLSPYDLLPFECLNGIGRQISEFNSKFVGLRNNEKYSREMNLDLTMSSDGQVKGSFKRKNRGYAALEIRELVKLEGEEGYCELIRNEYPMAEIRGFELSNLSFRDSTIVEHGMIIIEDGIEITGEEYLINPFFEFGLSGNIFIAPTRSLPVDYGSPINENYSLSLAIPSGYHVAEVPERAEYSVGSDDAKYTFDMLNSGNTLIIKSSFNINKTTFLPDEYQSIREFYAKILLSQQRLIVLKKNE